MTGDQVGALAFGAVIGWFAYSIVRKRAEPFGLGDIATLVGAIGGAGVLALYPTKSGLFGWYGIGLAIGFFGYFAILMVLILKSQGAGWSVAYFIDGRRPAMTDEQTSGPAAMGTEGASARDKPRLSD